MKDNIIEKPDVLRKEELKQYIFSAINNSHLPIYLVDYIIQEIANEVHSANINYTSKIREQYMEERSKKEECPEDAECEHKKE